MMHRLGIPALAAGTLLIGLVGLTLADTVHRKDGRKVDGEIIEESDAEIVVQTKFGPVTIPKSEVLKVSKGATPIEQFRDRWDEIDKGDALALLDLSDWCKENRLSRESRKVLREVIKVEPENELARRGLGYEKVDGEWKTRSEIAAAEKKAKAEARRNNSKSTSKGSGGSGSKRSGSDPLANVGDVSSIVRELLAPIKENESEDLATKAELEDFFGQDFNVASSTHFSLRCQMPMPDVHSHLTLAERIFVTCNKLFGREPAQQLWNGKFTMFHVKQEGTFIDLIDWVDKNLKGLDAETKKFFKDNPNGMQISGLPLAARKESELPFERGMAHWLGDTYMTWISGSAAPNWLQEGFGAYVAIMEFGANEMSCSTNTKYANRVEMADKTSDGAYKLICYDIIDGALEEPHPFLEMTQKSLNQLDFADLAKSWSIIDFLMHEHPKEFVKFVQSHRMYGGNSEETLRKVFDWSCEDLDKNWAEYVKGNYSRTPDTK